VYNCTAIIIEPREHKSLEFVMTNFTDNLDERWNFILFHGNKNEDFVNNIIKNKLQNQIHRIKLLNLNVDNLTINDYNALFYDKSFYDNIPTEVFLVFQTDTIICKNFKDNIYKFIEYDYSGAPLTNGEVGNGGLSLRRKSKMLEILEKCSNKKYCNSEETVYCNEDILFSNGLCSDLLQLNKPNFEDAKEFSTETVYSDKSFGMHAPWKHLSQDDIKSINEYCPELNTLISL
jgi:hypothetical protein